MIAHGGIVCDDPRRGHGLVAHRPRTTGASRRGSRRVPAPGPIGRPVRAEGWVVRTPAPIVDTAGRIVGPRRDRPGHVRGRPTSPPTRPASASCRPATAPPRAARDVGEAGRAGGRMRATAVDAASRRSTSHRPRPARPPSSPNGASRRGARQRAWPSSSHDPDAFADALAAGFRRARRPEYLAGPARSRRGSGRPMASAGRSWPRSRAGSETATRRERATGCSTSPTACSAEPELEPHWFAFGILERTLPADPERDLAAAPPRRARGGRLDHGRHPRPSRSARGILREPYRWAELEQLVFSPSRWERRLVGSTIATIPFVDRRRGRAPEIAEHGLALLAELIGDAEPDVQKALSWALPLARPRRPRRGPSAFVERRGRAAAAGTTTATAPGSSATPCRSSTRRRCGRDPRPPRRASAAGPARRPRRAPPRPPPASRALAGLPAPSRPPRPLPRSALRPRRSSTVTDDLGDIRAIRIEDEMRVALPRLRDERHRGARPAGRPRRPQAGPPPDPLHDGRDGPRRPRAPTASARRSSAR